MQKLLNILGLTGIDLLLYRVISTLWLD